MSTAGIKRWHWGQLLIAWIGLGMSGIAIIVAWLALTDVVGHRGWPNADRAACLRTAPTRTIDVLEALKLLRALKAHASHRSFDDLPQQLGLVPRDSIAWVRAGQAFVTPTPESDTSQMLADVNRFEVYKDSLDTLVQNAYFSARGLRLDRECMETRYISANRRIAVLTWSAGLTLLALPLVGLWMTWVWFGARTRPV